MKSRCTCTTHSWSSVRPSGKVIFVATVDNHALRFLDRLMGRGELVWYATTEGLSRLDDKCLATARTLRIIAASSFVRQMLQQVGVPTAGVLHHGIDMSDRRIDVQFYRRWKDKLRGRRVILTVAANHLRKGLDRLLAAYKIVEEEDRDVFLIVHSQRRGYYPLRKQSKSLNIKGLWLTNLFGKLTQPQLNALYKLCTTYVQPSLSEGFGLPILEAFRFDRGVIAVDAPPFNEIVRNRQTGLLIPSAGIAWYDFADSISFRLHTYTPEKLARAMSDYLFDRKFRAKVQAAVKREKWRWDAGRLYPELLSYLN